MPSTIKKNMLLLIQIPIVIIYQIFRSISGICVVKTQLSQEIENNFYLLMTLGRCIEMLVVQRVNRKSCIWYNMYLCSGINKISHLLETGVSDPCKDKYVADCLGSPEEFVDNFRYY